MNRPSFAAVPRSSAPAQAPGARVVRIPRQREADGALEAPAYEVAAPRVLVIIQNLHVPFDRRVWLECQSLLAAGYDVTVVCPAGKDSVPHSWIDGVEVWTYPPYAPGGSAAGFVAEYAYSYAQTARLVRRARRRGPFAVMQACNPPDIFWPLARRYRRKDGTRFVFDHHDLCPELYESRFPDGASLPHRGLLFLERMTFHTADRVTSTNESYAAVARRRGDKPASHVSVVRTGPDPERLRRIAVAESWKRDRKHLVAYLGVMGPQDGVDLALAAADHVVRVLGRDDVAFTFMGSGDSHAELVAERDRLGLGDVVELPGRVSDDYVAGVLSASDLGLCPDPKNPLNDVSTMNKTMEYMAYELPVVAFDLIETRVSARDAARYVTPNRVEEFAAAIVALLDDPATRAEMGRIGRRRVEQELGWGHQQATYVAVFDELTGRVGSGRVADPSTRSQSSLLRDPDARLDPNVEVG